MQKAHLKKAEMPTTGISPRLELLFPRPSVLILLEKEFSLWKDKYFCSDGVHRSCQQIINFAFILKSYLTSKYVHHLPMVQHLTKRIMNWEFIKSHE
jgi:hypothetical protein